VKSTHGYVFTIAICFGKGIVLASSVVKKVIKINY